MRVLGLHCGHDSSIAIAEDGKIIFACEEERLTGEKKQTGFPARSLVYACNRLGIGIKDFDKVVYSQKGNFFFRPTWPQFVDKENLFKDAVFNDHHYSHAVSAYCMSGFDDCIVMTLDGGGDSKFGSIYKGSNGKLTLIAENIFREYPFGLFYNDVTGCCGFTPNRHEGKIMGLAAHGKIFDLFDGMFWVDGTQIRSHGKKTSDYDVEPFVANRLVEVNKKTGSTVNVQDVASSAQKTFEDIVLEWVRINAAGQNLVVAGGSFANVLVNMKIAKIVKRLFVTPPMFDNGLAIGAAFSAFDTLPNNRPQDMYLGFDNVPSAGRQYKAKEVAQMIVDGKIVGLFQGKMEFGPRALGNRSILADPRNHGINQTLNKRLHRSDFMPFAPVILEEYADDILDDYQSGIDNAPFMTSCWSVNPKWRGLIPAVVHIDGTARPQVISREVNPYYYDIIDEFRKLTGVPVLINTSFNGHESPILASTAEAEWMLSIGQIDVLVEN